MLILLHLLLVSPIVATLSGLQSPGAVVAVGGGGTTERILARTLELSGGKDARVVVLPQSSALPDAGDGSVTMWLDAGAAQVRTLDLQDPGARAVIEAATLIWMPGGDQNRFMKAIAGTGLVDVIRARHRAGVTVGGTSAGAAVLSASMITGEADLQSLMSGKTTLAPGLGVVPDAILDQHFLRRQRTNRLLSAVLDHPQLIGVGIDEATAAIFKDGRIEAVGRSAVVIFDARDALVAAAVPGEVVAGQRIRTAVLREGMTYSLSGQ